MFKDNSSRPLSRALWSTYWKEFSIVLALQSIRSALLISRLFLIPLILEYFTNDENSSAFEAFIYVVLYILVELITSFIGEILNFLQIVINLKAKAAIFLLIYRKILTQSSATNKFTKGEIINFFEIDLKKIQIFIYNLSLITKFLVQSIYPVVLLSINFGSTLLISLGVGFAFSLTCLIIGKVKAIVQVKIMREKDKRMRTTTELVNNIKSIKLNSLTHYFSQKIANIRNNELFL